MHARDGSPGKAADWPTSEVRASAILLTDLLTTALDGPEPEGSEEPREQGRSKLSDSAGRSQSSS
jgi:hypothetical protein